MKSMKTLLSVTVLGLFMAACNQGGGSNSPVTSPNSNPAPNAYTVSDDNAPHCLKGQRFHDHDEMCRSLYDDQNKVCELNDRYQYFQTACHGIDWQGRHPNDDSDRRPSDDNGRSGRQIQVDSDNNQN